LLLVARKKVWRRRTASTRTRHGVCRRKHGVRLPGPKGIVRVLRWLIIFGGRFPAVLLVHTGRLLVLAVLGRFHGFFRFHRLGGLVRRFLRDFGQRRGLLRLRHGSLDGGSGLLWQRGRLGGPI